MAASTPSREESTTINAGGDAGKRTRAALKESDKDRTEDELLSIGELAKRARVSPRTIRYYEELSILPVPPRTAGGTRRYPLDYIFYVEGALLLKEMGFTLEEIGELGRWALDRTSVSSDRMQALLQGKVALLEHRIKVLNRLHELIVEATRGRSKKTKPTPELLRLLGEEAQMSSTEGSPQDDAGKARQ